VRALIWLAKKKQLYAGELVMRELDELLSADAHLQEHRDVLVCAIRTQGRSWASTFSIDDVTLCGYFGCGEGEVQRLSGLTPTTWP